MTTPVLQLRFDMRAPGFGAPAAELYSAALDMAEYADRHGLDNIVLSEHHGSDDGYLPSSITLAAAMAARTRRIRFHLAAIVAPLYDPLHLAEQVAVLDLISGGRITLVLAGGYVEAEFAMFGKTMNARAAQVEHAVHTLRAAWRGEPFDYQGRRVQVTPKPLQAHLPIVLGGSVPAAAQRAARIADGFRTHLPELHRVYAEAALALGRTPAAFLAPGPGCVYVAEDVDAAWAELAPHALHEMNAYGRWAAASGRSDSFYRSVDSVAAIKASGSYAVVTPAQCVELVRRNGNLLLHPLVGGSAPALGWRSLELFVERVLPELRG